MKDWLLNVVIYGYILLSLFASIGISVEVSSWVTQSEILIAMTSFVAGIFVWSCLLRITTTNFVIFTQIYTQITQD